jgi:hypothetical protein
MEEKPKKKKARTILKIVYSLVILGLLYYLGFPLYYIAIMAVIILALILLKGKLYRKLDSLLSKILPFLSKLSPTAKKIIIVVVFVLIWIILKQIIFAGFKLAGIDIQKIMIESVNQSVK